MIRQQEANTAKPPFYLVAVIFLLTVLSACHPTQDLSPPTALLSIAVGGATVAWLISSAGWLWGLLTLLPVGALSFYLADDSLLAVLHSLLYIVPGISFALVSKKRITRSLAVGISATVLTASVLLLLTLPVWQDLGRLSADAYRQYYATFFEELKETLKSSFTITVAGSEMSYVSDANADQYLNMVLALMPGIIGFASVCLGYLCGWCYKLLRRITYQAPPDYLAWRLMPSPVTGVTLVIAVLLMLLGSNVSYPWFVAVTFVLVLCPGFCLRGIASVFEIRIIDGLPRPRILRGLLLIVGMFSGLPGLVIVSSLFGIYDSIRSGFPQKTKES